MWSISELRRSLKLIFSGLEVVVVLMKTIDPQNMSSKLLHSIEKSQHLWFSGIRTIYHRIAGHLPPPFLIVENTCRQFFRDICRKLILNKDICRKKTFLQVHYNHFQNPTCRKMALVENSNLKMLNPATCRKKLSTNGTCRKFKFENAKFSNL